MTKRPYDPARYRRWYEANRARKLAQVQQWREDHREERKAWLTEYYATGTNAAKCRKWRRDHPDYDRKRWKKDGPRLNAARRKGPSLTGSALLERTLLTQARARFQSLKAFPPPVPVLNGIRLTDTHIPLNPVDSSTIKAVGYDETTGTMAMSFHSGGLYHYQGVTPEGYKALLHAYSKGQHFAAHIKSRYKGVKQPLPPVRAAYDREDASV